MCQQQNLIDLLENIQPAAESHHTPELHSIKQTVSDYQQGLTALHRDDYSQAIQWFQLAVAKNPALAQAWYQMGQCYLQLTQQNELLSAYQQTLQNDFEQESRDLNGLALASQSLRQAVLLKPQHAQAWELLAKSYELSGETEKAFAAYQALKKIKPDNQAANSYLNKIEAIRNGYSENEIDDQLKLAQRFYQMGLVQQALKTYSHAATLTPNNHTALCQQAIIHFDQQQYNKAMGLYQQIVHQTPDFAIAHFKLGLCYFYRSQFYDAVKSYRKAIEFNPKHPQAHYQLAITYLTIGWNDQAMATHKTLRRQDPHLASNLLDLILEFRSQGND